MTALVPVDLDLEARSRDLAFVEKEDDRVSVCSEIELQVGDLVLQTLDVTIGGDVDLAWRQVYAPAFARVIRGPVLSVVQEEYVTAGKEKTNIAIKVDDRARPGLPSRVNLLVPPASTATST